MRMRFPVGDGHLGDLGWQDIVGVGASLGGERTATEAKVQTVLAVKNALSRAYGFESAALESELERCAIQREFP